MAEEIIAGREFRCEKLPASEALKLLGRVLKVAGPAIGAVQGALASGSEADRDATLVKALGDLAAGADMDSAVRLVVDLSSLSAVRVNGAFEPVVFDHHFAANLLDAFKVAAFVLRVQFGDFFAAGMAAASRATKRMPAGPSA